jgi:hypothetical protein
MRAKVSVVRVALDLPAFPFLMTMVVAPAILWPLLPWIFGDVLQQFMGLRTRMSWRVAKVGIASMPLLFAPRLMPLLGLAGLALDTSVPEPLRFLVGTLLWLVGSIALYPIYAAPLEMIDRNLGFVDGLASAVAKSARQPWHRTLQRAFAVACAGALPWFALLVAIGTYRLTSDLERFRLLLGLSQLTTVALIPVCIAASPFFVLALVAHAWSEGQERFGSARTSPTERHAELPLQGPMRRRLSGALVVAFAAPLLLVSLGTLWTVGLPTRAWRTPPNTASTLAPDAVGTFHLPTASQLTIERTHVGIEIAAADGGGAGKVRMPCQDRVSAQFATEERVFRERFRGQEVWTYRMGTGACASAVSFNDEGVRVDDTIEDRIVQRWGGRGLWLALAIALLCALATFDQLRWVRRARGLEGALIEGRILGGSARTQGQMLIAEEGLRIDLGEHGLLTLPAEGTLALLYPSAQPRTLVAGDKLAILTTQPSQQGSPFRDAHAAPPREVRVVPGTLDQAREGYVHFATKRIALAGLVSLAGSLVFTLFVAFHR